MLMEVMLRRKECKTKGVPPKIIIPKDKGDIKELKITKDCFILGTTLQKNLQWQAHIETTEYAIHQVLR